jgi:hypothetical protein
MSQCSSFSFPGPISENNVYHFHVTCRELLRPPERSPTRSTPPKFQPLNPTRAPIGVLHSGDKICTTAYSYFFKTFKNLGGLDDAKGALKYMLL